MATTIVTTDPSEQRDAPVEEAGMSRTQLLTRRQIRCMEQLPDGHEVVGVRDGVPIVHQPGGQMLRMQPNGDLVTVGVQMVRSYLEVHG